MIDRIPFKLYATCVNWPAEDVEAPGGLNDLVDQMQDVTREVIMRRVDPDNRHEVEAELGYTRSDARGKAGKEGIKMADDHHVRYFKSLHHGEVVYGFVQSAIEYVFKKDKPTQ